MSNHRDSTQSAHLCPRQELDWFTSNGMREYNLDRYLPTDLLTDDANNALTLRADLHFAFDRCVFVFVPKPVSSAPVDRSSSRFVTHVLNQTSEIGPLYHNAALLPLRGVKPEFLLTRFAWAIFPLVAPFVNFGVERSLLLLKNGVSTAEEVSATDCLVHHTSDLIGYIDG
jgi:hypothetical protein